MDKNKDNENCVKAFQAARRAWERAETFRKRRERYKRYTYGDQWSDIAHDRHGRIVREADLIVASGHKPLINNMIRQIVKIVIGRYRSACKDEGIYACEGRPYVSDNALLELDCRMLEEFLISGCAVQRISRELRRGEEKVWIDNVDPRAFFVNAFSDPRGYDIELIGMLHDLSLHEILERFSERKGDVPYRKIAEAYCGKSKPAGADSFASRGSLLGSHDTEAYDFSVPREGRCRLIEVWTLECNCTENYRFSWVCRWFAPDGTLLHTEMSPYSHGSHPFVVKLYPLTDGEVHSFVEDVIDQQRCINRMIVLIDHIVGASAKGVLLFPGDQKPKHVAWEDIAEAWARTDGVIPITGMGPHLPQQVVTKNADAGAYQLLSLQMKLFDNISGINDVMAGRNISPSTGNAVYENQLRNSAIALSDLIDSFAAFRNARDKKAENI